METTNVDHSELGLTSDEYSKIVSLLGREPNIVELYMYSLMWSEHCGYKHSKNTLKKFPVTGKYVLQGPGENAGIVDIGDGFAIAMKIESHNHPSAIEPYQGAATGVGGIVRDIFAMGARPIATLNSLRFGSLSKAKQRYLLEHVVAGIAGYGNCIGVPTVGGEIYFDDSYLENCLVNAMCVGLIKNNEILSAKAKGIGNKVVLIGSKTGRDGIGGASILASQEFDETSEGKRPSVQVGDPFTEKLLIECCLELRDKGLLVSLQDLGAAGLTSSSAEMASSGDVGMDIYASEVPVREPNMEPWEIMVSESQERMLAVVEPEQLNEVFAVCEKWGLDATLIGEVTASKKLNIYKNGTLVASMPVHSLAKEAPRYNPASKKPAYIDDLKALPLPKPKTTLEEECLRILESPNISSKKWAYQQYDHQVGLNTILLPGADSSVLRIKGTKKAIALTTDGNGRYCYLDPYAGAKIAVLEAARNVISAGAKPIAVTDCLNFGNPEKPGVFYQFDKCVSGIADVCTALEIPVVSGNVSFYNESPDGAIFPTPVIGLLGLIEDINKTVSANFKSPDDIILLIGETFDELGGSEYLSWVLKSVSGKLPKIDTQTHIINSGLVLNLINNNLVESVHDVSDGGLWVALVESCLGGCLGAKIKNISEHDDRSFLFSETQSRYLISVKKQSLGEIIALTKDADVAISELGTVLDKSQGIAINNLKFEYNVFDDIFNNSLERTIDDIKG